MAVFEKVLPLLKEGKVIARSMINENSVYRISRNRGTSNNVEMWSSAEPEREARDEIKDEESGKVIQYGCSHMDARPARWVWSSIDTSDLFAFDWIVLTDKDIKERGIEE